MTILGRLFHRMGHEMIGIANLVDQTPPPPPPPPPRPPTEKELAHARWVKDMGDKTLRLNYPIRSDEVVVDVGGFEGQWTSDIYSKYLCTIHVFEPLETFASAIKERFKNNKDIFVYQSALGSENGEINFSVSGDASSAFVSSESTVVAPIISFEQWAKCLNGKEIALMKINIEGGEYQLLEHIIEIGAIKQIRDIQIQFHDFVDDADTKMHHLLEQLSHTHFPTYQYKYVWENWQRKDA